VTFTPPQGIQSPPRIPWVAVNTAGTDVFVEVEVYVPQWGFMITDIILADQDGTGGIVGTISDAITGAILANWTSTTGDYIYHWTGEQWFAYSGTLRASGGGSTGLTVRISGYLIPDLNGILALT
jgi:hypothetical protein